MYKLVRNVLVPAEQAAVPAEQAEAAEQVEVPAEQVDSSSFVACCVSSRCLSIVGTGR